MAISGSGTDYQKIYQQILNTARQQVKNPGVPYGQVSTQKTPAKINYSPNPVRVNKQSGSGGGVIGSTKNDTVVIGKSATVSGIQTSSGNDTVRIDGAASGIQLGVGDDVLRLGRNSQQNGAIAGGGGYDRLFLEGSSKDWTIKDLGGGNWQVTNKNRVPANGTPGTVVTGFEAVRFVAPGAANPK